MSTNAPNFRVGIGYDVHQLVTGRPLIIGGVEIPHTHGLDGHSDADVLCHAIADAVLGALGMLPIPPPSRCVFLPMPFVSRAGRRAAGLAFTGLSSRLPSLWPR